MITAPSTPGRPQKKASTKHNGRPIRIPRRFKHTPLEGMRRGRKSFSSSLLLLSPSFLSSSLIRQKSCLLTLKIFCRAFLSSRWGRDDKRLSKQQPLYMTVGATDEGERRGGVAGGREVALRPSVLNNKNRHCFSRHVWFGWDDDEN